MIRGNLTVDRFLEDVSGRYAEQYTDAIHDMVVAMARGNRVALDDARKRLGRVISETMGVGEVMGAAQVLRSAAGLVAENEGDDRLAVLSQADIGELLAFKETQPLLPKVSFDEAIEDLVSRAPRTIQEAAQRTAKRISHLYSEERVIAFARSAEDTVTKKVQSIIAQALKDGTGEVESGKLIKSGVDSVRKKTRAWSESYSRTVFRNNVNTAVTAGRFRQARDPDIRAVVPAFRFETAGDGDVRHNHEKLNRLIFKVDNPVWNRIAPPLGHSCRCQVRLMSVLQLRRMNRIDPDGSVRESRLPSDAGPDQGFRHGGRPDLLMVQ